MCLKKTSLTWKTFRLGAKPCEMNLSMHEASSLPLPEEWIRKGTACSPAIKYHKRHKHRNALTQIFSLIELVDAWYTSSSLFRPTIGLTNIFTHWHSQIGVLTKQIKCTLKFFSPPRGRLRSLGSLHISANNLYLIFVLWKFFSPPCGRLGSLGSLHILTKCICSFWPLMMSMCFLKCYFVARQIPPICSNLELIVISVGE